ncbi:unnamed protein product [Amoebophrya sp. A120]|nr:unnamed protein product [Amoebophrya sp. A120]|eukprot:GSA120T00004641001.1
MSSMIQPPVMAASLLEHAQREIELFADEAVAKINDDMVQKEGKKTVDTLNKAIPAWLAMLLKEQYDILTTRMTQAFSHMLQGLQADLLESAKADDKRMRDYVQNFFQKLSIAADVRRLKTQMEQAQLDIRRLQQDYESNIKNGLQPDVEKAEIQIADLISNVNRIENDKMVEEVHKLEDKILLEGEKVLDIVETKTVALKAWQRDKMKEFQDQTTDKVDKFEEKVDVKLKTYETSNKNQWLWNVHQHCYAEADAEKDDPANLILDYSTASINSAGPHPPRLVPKTVLAKKQQYELPTETVALKEHNVLTDTGITPTELNKQQVLYSQDFFFCMVPNCYLKLIIGEEVCHATVEEKRQASATTSTSQPRRVVGCYLVLQFPKEVDYERSTIRVEMNMNGLPAISDGRGPRFVQQLNRVTEIGFPNLGVANVLRKGKIAIELLTLELDLKWRLLPGLNETQRQVDARSTLNQEIEIMRGRNVKSVSWQIPNILNILDSPDEEVRTAPIISPSFTLAGIDQVQFIFYPNGYQPAYQDACGLFLCCPRGGCYLKAEVSIGGLAKNTRLYQHEYTNKELTYGRGSFCNVYDGIDKVTNTIEITAKVLDGYQYKTKLGEADKSLLKVCLHPSVDGIQEIKALFGAETDDVEKARARQAFRNTSLASKGINNVGSSPRLGQERGPSPDSETRKMKKSQSGSPLGFGGHLSIGKTAKNEKFHLSPNQLEKTSKINNQLPPIVTPGGQSSPVNQKRARILNNKLEQSPILAKELKRQQLEQKEKELERRKMERKQEQTNRAMLNWKKVKKIVEKMSYVRRMKTREMLDRDRERGEFRWMNQYWEEVFGNDDEWQFDPVANKKRKQQQMLAETLEAGLSSLLTAIGEVKAEPDKLPLLLKTVGDDLKGVMGEVAEVMVAIENPENVVVDEEGEVRVEKKPGDLKKKKRKKQTRVAAAGNEDVINCEILGEEEEDEEQDSDAEDDIAEALFEIETKDFEVEHNEKLRRRSRSPKAGTNASSKANSRKQSPGSPHSASKSPHGGFRDNNSSTRPAPGMKSKSPKASTSGNKKPVPTGGVAIPAQKKPATTTSQTDTWPNPLPPKPENENKPNIDGPVPPPVNIYPPNEPQEATVLYHPHGEEHYRDELYWESKGEVFPINRFAEYSRPYNEKARQADVDWKERVREKEEKLGRKSFQMSDRDRDIAVTTEEKFYDKDGKEIIEMNKESQHEEMARTFNTTSVDLEGSSENNPLNQLPTEVQQLTYPEDNSQFLNTTYFEYDPTMGFVYQFDPNRSDGFPIARLTAEKYREFYYEEMEKGMISSENEKSFPLPPAHLLDTIEEKEEEISGAQLQQTAEGGDGTSSGGQDHAPEAIDAPAAGAAAAAGAPALYYPSPFASDSDGEQEHVVEPSASLGQPVVAATISGDASPRIWRDIPVPITSMEELQNATFSNTFTTSGQRSSRNTNTFTLTNTNTFTFCSNADQECAQDDDLEENPQRTTFDEEEACANFPSLLLSPTDEAGKEIIEGEHSEVLKLPNSILQKPAKRVRTRQISTGEVLIYDESQLKKLVEQKFQANDGRNYCGEMATSMIEVDDFYPRDDSHILVSDKATGQTSLKRQDQAGVLRGKLFSAKVLRSASPKADSFTTMNSPRMLNYVPEKSTALSQSPKCSSPGRTKSLSASPLSPISLMSERIVEKTRLQAMEELDIEQPEMALKKEQNLLMKPNRLIHDARINTSSNKLHHLRGTASATFSSSAASTMLGGSPSSRATRILYDDHLRKTLDQQSDPRFYDTFFPKSYKRSEQAEKFDRAVKKILGLTVKQLVERAAVKNNIRVGKAGQIEEFDQHLHCEVEEDRFIQQLPLTKENRGLFMNEKQKQMEKKNPFFSSKWNFGSEDKLDVNLVKEEERMRANREKYEKDEEGTVDAGKEQDQDIIDALKKAVLLGTIDDEDTVGKEQAADKADHPDAATEVFPSSGAFVRSASKPKQPVPLRDGTLRMMHGIGMPVPEAIGHRYRDRNYSLRKQKKSAEEVLAEAGTKFDLTTAKSKVERDETHQEQELPHHTGDHPGDSSSASTSAKKRAFLKNPKRSNSFEFPRSGNDRKEKLKDVKKFEKEYDLARKGDYPFLRAPAKDEEFLAHKLELELDEAGDRAVTPEATRASMDKKVEREILEKINGNGSHYKRSPYGISQVNYNSYLGELRKKEMEQMFHQDKLFSLHPNKGAGGTGSKTSGGRVVVKEQSMTKSASTGTIATQSSPRSSTQRKRLTEQSLKEDRSLFLQFQADDMMLKDRGDSGKAKY